MPEFLKSHFDTEGPLGLPMKDSQAQMLDSLLKSLPQEERKLSRLVTTKGISEVLDGERADVSWITTEEIDRDNEIVVARGMNDSHFKLNPIVTLNHNYYMPPVGKSLWRKSAKDGTLKGIKAKTQYPARPESWPQNDDWPSDQAFALVQSGLMIGKSIGFLPLKRHSPNTSEIAGNPELAKVRTIIDDWLLLEYSCTFLPCNQASVVEAVSKGLKLPQPIMDEIARLFNIDPATLTKAPEPTPEPQHNLVVPFTSEAEIIKAINRQIEGFDYEKLAKDAIDRARGRI